MKKYIQEGRKTKKTLPMLLIALVASALYPALSIPQVKASEPIAINADGGFSPPDAPVSSLDNVTYTLIADTNNSIMVERSNIVVDGASHTVQGDGTENGFTLNEVVNVTIKNARIEGCFDGIQLFNSSGSIITGNTVIGNSYEGVGVYYSSNNIIASNSITNNQLGISFYYSLGNSLFHNSFVNNSIQAYEESSVSKWDSGYPLGGNYWSDCADSDEKCGLNQDYPGRDGIGDTPYFIEASNSDRYPLMKPLPGGPFDPYPWEAHDVGVACIGRAYTIGVGVEVVFPPRAFEGLNLLLHLDVFVVNYGDYAEALNLTVYANNTVLGQFSNVTLAARNSTILKIQWSTSGFALGNYNISAHLEPVPGESDVEDNNYTVGYTTITILGDVNGDGKVDMKDIGYIARRFGRPPTSSSWDPSADINDDGKIDMKDIGISSRHFGGHFP